VSTASIAIICGTVIFLALIWASTRIDKTEK